MKSFKEYFTNLTEGSVKEYVDERLKKSFAKEGIQVKPIIKTGFTKYVFSTEPSDIELVNDGVNLIVKQGGKELEVFDNIKLNYSKCVSFILDKIENKVNEALKANFSLKDNNIFLTYPRDIIMDIEDSFGSVIDDYDIENEKVTLWFTSKVTKDIAAKIVNKIKSGK